MRCLAVFAASRFKAIVFRSCRCQQPHISQCPVACQTKIFLVLSHNYLTWQTPPAAGWRRANRMQFALRSLWQTLANLARVFEWPARKARSQHSTSLAPVTTKTNVTVSVSGGQAVCCFATICPPSPHGHATPTGAPSHELGCGHVTSLDGERPGAKPTLCPPREPSQGSGLAAPTHLLLGPGSKCFCGA